ncbi:hypothetical protein FRC0426_01974 [Corynebacterium diphtheriae]|nr:hypothetical protein FRC0426_01974 [Corynebacterium diphtheriae]
MGCVLGGLWVWVRLGGVWVGGGGGRPSLVLGTILTAMRVSPVGVLRSISTGYINIVRNTPLTLVVLFCSFGLYQTLRLQLVSREPETFLATNNFRLAVLGLSFTQTFRFFVFPQALRAAIVPLGNTLIALIN